MSQDDLQAALDELVSSQSARPARPARPTPPVEDAPERPKVQVHDEFFQVGNQEDRFPPIRPPMRPASGVAEALAEAGGPMMGPLWVVLRESFTVLVLFWATIIGFSLAVDSSDLNLLLPLGVAVVIRIVWRSLELAIRRRS